MKKEEAEKYADLDLERMIGEWQNPKWRNIRDAHEVGQKFAEKRIIELLRSDGSERFFVADAKAWANWLEEKL